MASCIWQSVSLTFFWTTFFVRINQHDCMTLRQSGLAVFPVNNCPRNLSEVEAATLRLNCSDIKGFRNVYHCLPSSNLSLLVEFCYNRTSGLTEKGNCLVLSNEYINVRQCNHFTRGCPSVPYYYKEMFNFPDCTRINKQNICYEADPSCPSISIVEATTRPTLTVMENNFSLVETTTMPAVNAMENIAVPIAIVLGVLLLCVCITFIILWTRRRYRSYIREKKDIDSATGLKETFPLMEKKDNSSENSGTENTPTEFKETFPMMAKEDNERNESIDSATGLKETSSLMEKKDNLSENSAAKNTSTELEETSVLLAKEEKATYEGTITDYGEYERGFEKTEKMEVQIKKKERRVGNLEDQMQRIEMGSWGKDDAMTLVAAIDFGSWYSNYAFGLRHCIEENHPKMFFPTWQREGVFLSPETTTAVLLDGEKQFVAFGFEAEEKYADLAEGEHKEYFYFPRFKMTLYDKVQKERLTMNTTVPDILNKEIPAIEIFTHVIRYFKEQLLNHLKQIDIFMETYIFWVVTVPAIWDDPGKEFMREAAEKAGIKKDKLIIALESEAASTWCKHLLVEKLQGNGDKADSFQVGRKYVVLDAGDETVDLTLHEVEGGGKLRELTMISGGGFGGVSVDNAFKAALTEIVGEDLMDKLRRKYEADYITLFRDFQIKRRRYKKSEDVFVTLKIPPSFLDNWGNMTRKISSSKYNGNMQAEADKLRINHSTFEDFFRSACVKIVDLVRQLLKSPDGRGVDLILMVGRFSESQLLQDAVKRAFSSKYHIFIPEEPRLAVICGAVLFGKSPNICANTR